MPVGEVEPVPANGTPGTTLPRPILDALAPAGRARPALEADLARALARGRIVTALAWLVALLHGVLGLVAVRQAAMLVDLDAELVTTAPIEALGSTVLPVRILLGLVIVIAAGLAVRWLRRAVITMTALRRVASGEDVGRLGDAADGGPTESTAPASTFSDGRIGALFDRIEPPATSVGWSSLAVGDGRRPARAALATTFAAALVGAIAAAGLATATDVDAARTWRWVAGLDAGLWIVATVLLGGVASGIGWRLAAAGRAVGVFAPLIDAPGRAAVRLAPALLLFGGLVPAAANAPSPIEINCPGTTLTCGAVIVPVQHGGGPSQPTISIVYGVHEATGPAIGTLVVAVGGPGASGLQSAEPRIEGFPADLVARYDIVFWDQRGIGKSDGHDCPIAGGIYSGVGPSAESARAFVDACLREADTGVTDLGRYATTQAAEDLEAIRRRLGVERFVLYGESYGTELAQLYAAAHPDRLSALILDGPVDLTLTANDFWSAAAYSFDHTLAATFARCEADSVCRGDVRDPAAAYDRLLGRLDDGPIVATYADPTGIAADHTIDRRAVEGAVASLMYEPFGRSLVQRAVAASAGGDFVPLGRLVDLYGPGINIGFSAFAYHAILCADYRVSPTADVADYDAVVRYGEETGALRMRTDDVYYAQVPCLFWPVQPATPERPGPLTTLTAPTFVLGAELDPITPIEFGRAIAARAADGYLIETSGGPHVTFGRGLTCVDDAVTRFLVAGVLPDRRAIHCADVATEDYIPLTPLDADDFRDALHAMTSLEHELFADPLNGIWEGTGSISIGCRNAGAVLVTTTGTRATYEFVGCEYARGMPLDGTGSYEEATGTVTFDVTFPGGSLRYTSDGSRTVRGSFRGDSVDQHE